MPKQACTKNLIISILGRKLTKYILHERHMKEAFAEVVLVQVSSGNTTVASQHCIHLQDSFSVTLYGKGRCIGINRHVAKMHSGCLDQHKLAAWQSPEQGL